MRSTVECGHACSAISHTSRNAAQTCNAEHTSCGMTGSMLRLVKLACCFVLVDKRSAVLELTLLLAKIGS